MAPKAKLEGILDDQKKRAAMLKAQGWTTADVCKDTGVPCAAINLNWRVWAAEFGIELPAAKASQQPSCTSNLVTSYRVDPATGEQLTEPVTEAVELGTKSMPSDFVSAPQQAKKAPRPKAAAEPELPRYSPCELLEGINRLIWAQVQAGGLSDEYCYQAEIADGVLSVSFALPVKGGKVHGQ